MRTRGIGARICAYLCVEYGGGRHTASSNADNYRPDVRTVNNSRAEIARAPRCAVREVLNSSKFLGEKSVSDPKNNLTYVREMRLNDEKR